MDPSPQQPPYPLDEVQHFFFKRSQSQQDILGRPSNFPELERLSHSGAPEPQPAVKTEEPSTVATGSTGSTGSTGTTARLPFPPVPKLEQLPSLPPAPTSVPSYPTTGSQVELPCCLVSGDEL